MGSQSFGTGVYEARSIFLVTKTSVKVNHQADFFLTSPQTFVGQSCKIWTEKYLIKVQSFSLTYKEIATDILLIYMKSLEHPYISHLHLQNLNSISQKKEIHSITITENSVSKALVITTEMITGLWQYNKFIIWMWWNRCKI